MRTLRLSLVSLCLAASWLPSPAAANSVDVSRLDDLLVVHGVDAGDVLGGRTHATAIADLDHDGALDLVVGASRSDGPANGRSNAGTIHVLFGPLPRGGTIDLRATPADLTIHGADVSDLLGELVAVGDLSGDGLPDLVASASGGDGPGNTQSAVGEGVVFFGPLGPGVVDLAVDAPDVLIHGCCRPAATVGDVSDDGAPDLVVASSSGLHGFFGPLVPGTVVDLAVDAADLRIHGADAGDGFGLTLAVGDVTGDAAADLCAGAPFADGPGNVGPTSSGEVQVFTGPLAPGVRDVRLVPAEATVHGDGEDGRFGATLTLGELTGDGTLELVVSGGHSEPRSKPKLGGEVHVVFGPLAPGTRELASAPPEASYYGTQPDQALGDSIVVADLTADGQPDLLALGPGGPVVIGPYKGKPIHGLVLGFAAPLAAGTVVNARPSAATIAFKGDDNRDWMGSAAAVGDLDGDGTLDLALAAREADGPDDLRDRCGEVWVVFDVASRVR